MKEEMLLTEVKPSAVILIPHLLLMIILVGFITIWKPLFLLISTNIRVTNKRISAKAGIIKTVSLDSPLSKITSVKVVKNLLGNILNYGTIYINTASGEFAFDYIPDVDKLKEIIMENLSQN